MGIVTVDFETKPIELRPKYPPEPVGVAIWEEGRKPRYMAWAHPEKNNCTWEEGVHAIQKIWSGKENVLFHNGAFDEDVAETFMGVSPLAWERRHDTLYLLFLADPDSATLRLKPAAEHWINLPPTERDELKDWILHNVRGATEKTWGAYIAHAPGDLVGVYAIGDVVRTRGLFDYLYVQIVNEGMQPAYDRERQLMPVLLQSEREGLRIHVSLLERDIHSYEKALLRTDDWLRKRFCAPALNIDSDVDLAKVLRSAGVVSAFAKTKTGRDSTARKNLTLEYFNDTNVFHALGYRNRLSTCLSTFMRKWLTYGTHTNRIHTQWNQVRRVNERGGNTRGARTGRITSESPPFTNIPKSWEGRNDKFQHPDFLDVPELPLIRKYVLPDEGQTFVHLDYNQQELRILAHFEDGPLMKAYKEEPRMDVHQYVTDSINRIIPTPIERRVGKLIDFGIVYGEGQGKLAMQIGCSVQQARAILQAHKVALPGLAALQRQIRTLCAAGQPVVTWGGRQYYCEEPKMIDGRMRTFEYKMLNRLIQPSAADCTKEALLRYIEHPKRQGRFLITVYDEINVSAEDWKHEVEVLRESMESVEFDLPMLTDAKVGENWADVEGV